MKVTLKTFFFKSVRYTLIKLLEKLNESMQRNKEKLIICES